MNSLDPKLTTAVYFGGGAVFLIFLLVLFFYTRSVKTKKLSETSGSLEEGILQATEKNHKVR